MKFEEVLSETREKMTVNAYLAIFLFIIIIAEVYCMLDLYLGDTREFSVINDDLQEIVGTIELNENGDFDPYTVTVPNGYNIDLTFDFNNQYWVITAESKTPGELQKCIKCLKLNGESTTSFKYMSESSYMRNFKLMFITMLVMSTVVVIFSIIVFYCILILLFSIFQILKILIANKIQCSKEKRKFHIV